jgi:hypothetical protein
VYVRLNSEGFLRTDDEVPEELKEEPIGANLASEVQLFEYPNAVNLLLTVNHLEGLHIPLLVSETVVIVQNELVLMGKEVVLTINLAVCSVPEVREGL